MNAQIILRPNGDFVTRSNDVETVCRRVNPDDWDDDGIHNERDANPTSANGGTNGAVLSVSATNLGKLQKNSGPAFPAQSVSVPARQSITYAMNYVGLSASESADDIEVVATLTDNVTGESITNDCQATAVRLELAAVWEAPENPCTNRHIYGVGERVSFKVRPQLSSVVLSTIKYDVDDTLGSYEFFDDLHPAVNAGVDRIYTCPISSNYVPSIKVQYAGVEFVPVVAIIEPQMVVTTGAAWGENAVDLYYSGNRKCWNSGDVGSAALVTTNHIGPLYVSFQGVAVSELPCDEEDTVTGCFTNGHSRTHTLAAPLLCCQTLAVQLRRTCSRMSRSIGVRDLGVVLPNLLIREERR